MSKFIYLNKNLQLKITLSYPPQVYVSLLSKRLNSSNEKCEVCQHATTAKANPFFWSNSQKLLPSSELHEILQCLMRVARARFTLVPRAANT